MKRQKTPGASPAPATSAPAAAGVRRRRWWFPLAALLLVPLTLGLLELVLRLAGAGHPTAFFVQHPAAVPGHVVENQRFPWLFFPPTLARHPDPLSITPAKPPGTVRLFVFGESAAEGDPAPAFGFSRILEVLLRERFPGVRFEVVNTAFTAISSHVILPIARDCAALDGDLWLVYMGNNEVIGPGGVATVFRGRSLPLPLFRASLALKRTRTGQLLAGLLARFATSPQDARGWTGLSMFMENQLPPGDPRLADVEAAFRRNLADLLAAARRVRVPVVLSTVASNLRDCAPFGSQSSPDLTPEQTAARDRALEAGRAAAASGDAGQAFEHYGTAAGLDDRSAELAFRLGRAALAVGHTNAARGHFERARDLDTLRFRTDSRLNTAIRAAAAGGTSTGVHLLDAEQAFAQASADGVPGGEWFYEHVHFNFAGNYVLARAFADALLPLLPAAVTANARADAGWLSEAGCARRLGYTPSQEHDILTLVAERLAEPIYGRQLNAAERREQIERRRTELRNENKPLARRRAAQAVRDALSLTPDDPVLHGLLARALTAAGEPEAAVQAWDAAAARRPHEATPAFESGEILVGQGRLDEAAVRYERAIALNPDFARAHEGLGLLRVRQGRPAEALRHLRQAVRLDPTRARAAEALAGLPAGR